MSTRKSMKAISPIQRTPVQSARAQSKAREAGSPQRGAGGIGPIVALLLVGTIAFFVWRSRDKEPEFQPLSLEEQYAQDERLMLLLHPCSFPAAFEADLTDIASVLVSKLDAGAQRDPLRRATQDLAAMGAPAKDALMRLYQARSKDRMQMLVANNVLAVCAISDDPFGLDIARIALESPDEQLRGDAMLVFRKHPSPEHYDDLRNVFPSFMLPVNVDHALQAMYKANPERFAEDLVQWVKDAKRVLGRLESRLIDSSVPLIAESDSPKVAEVLKGIVASTPDLQIRHRLFMLAPAARLGDQEAYQELTDMLASDRPRPRVMAAEALAKAGLVDDTYVLAETSRDPSESSRVFKLIFSDTYAIERTPEQLADVLSWARIALGHKEAAIQELALRFLLQNGDPEGIAALNIRLSGTVMEREIAARAMRGTFETQPEVATQVRNNLKALWEREEQGAQLRAVYESIAIALGAVPGVETGEFLMIQADRIGPNPVRGQRGYRWVLGQILNSGPEASTVMHERLKTEADPFKRLDLISQMWQDETEGAYAAIAAVIDDETKTPHERLYAADRALRMGMHEQLAPLLKRVYRNSSDPVLRPGLHCLLWAWYGPALA